MPLGKAEGWVGTQKFFYSSGDAWELGIVVIVDDKYGATNKFWNN